MQAVIFSLCFAIWCRWDLNRFCERINRQVFQDYQFLRGNIETFLHFKQHSRLKPKSMPWAKSIWWLFPLFAFIHENPIVAFLWMLLYFLTLLDSYYYLTDSRYIAVIFVLALLQPIPQIDTLIFTICFFTGLTLLLLLFRRTESFGMGDSLLFIAVSPLFSVTEMLQVILFACLFGLFFALIIFCKTQQKIDRLPFIPFISLAVVFVL